MNYEIPTTATPLFCLRCRSPVEWTIQGLCPECAATCDDAERFHPSAIIDEGAEIGEGTRIWHFCHVAAGARIGKGCVLGQNVYVAPTSVIGDRCKIQNNVSIYDGVVLEDEVFVGPSAVFTNVLNPRAAVERKNEYGKTVVERGATLGANATLIAPVRIGRYAFVGAGAVVTHDVDPHSIVAGVPALRIGRICFCGTTRWMNLASPTPGGCPGCSWTL